LCFDINFLLQALSSAGDDARNKSESSQKALMKRLFPDVNASAVGDKNHEKWVEHFVDEVKKCVVAAEQPIASSASDEDKHREDMEQLEKQVNHYKEVLAETVRKEISQNPPDSCPMVVGHTFFWKMYF
jgi:hypothetical protein